MAIKKQKRSLDETAAAGVEKSQNGGERKNKFEKQVKKMKLEKLPASKPVKKAVEIEVKASLPKDTKKPAKLVKKNEKRQEARKQQGQFKTDNINLSAEEIQEKIKEMKARESLTKTAKRKLGVLKKKLAILEGTYQPTMPPKSAAAPKNVASKKLEKKIKLETNKKATNGGSKDSSNKILEKPTNSVAQTKMDKKKAKKGADNKKVIVKQAEPEESDDEEEEEEEEDEEEAEEEDSDEEMDQSQAETSNASEEEDDDDDEEEEEDDEEEEEQGEEGEEDEEEGTKLPSKKNTKKELKTESPAKKQVRPEAASEPGKKKRFVLYVGNLSYQATEDDIRKHFSTKVKTIESVRIPMKPGTKIPRGFAYVELTNETDYQKGLGLHNTTINGRRINVEYTQGGSKSVGKRSDIVSKNKKLHAMRKSGMFAGKRDNRNERRQKQKQT